MPGIQTKDKWTIEQARAYFAKRKPYEPKKANKKSGDRAKGEMELILKLIGQPYQKEYEFHPTRKWRFDWAIPGRKIGIEYEGLFSEKSGHTTISGFTKDVEKYREAAKLGWTVLRYTNKDYTQLSEDVNGILNQKLL